MKILEEWFAGGARATELELLVGMRTTLPRRRRQVANRLSEEERQRILLTYNEGDLRRCRRVRSCRSWPVVASIGGRTQ